MQRRHFILSSLSAALAPAAGNAAEAPLKIGHRQASMVKEPGAAVLDVARRIPGVSGVELQVHFKGSSLWNRDTVLDYKREAQRRGLQIPSLAGIWARGASLVQPGPAEDNLRKAIQAAEALGARVILVAAFGDKCPKMNQEDSYGPVVTVLRKVAPAAASAGVTLGMETSLSPADDKKLIDLVNQPSVRVYYDADNVERFGHKGQGVPGFQVLEKSRIAQIHFKNEDRLLEEPGRVDWAAALKSVRQIGYDGWLVFESAHSGPDQCVDATRKNIEFIKRHLAFSKVV